jgi:hypothetical protein
MSRLTILVPYRDRAAHLARFAGHVSSYFARDVLARSIDYRVLVVEQEAGLPFNKGALMNAGFSLMEAESDYICVHDVDYLPVWADYSCPDVPTPILWYGAEARPVAPGRSAAGVVHDMENVFGGVVLVPCAQYRQVDGMSNEYWGWGIEDGDFRARFFAAGITPGRRRGTYQALDHDSNGYFPDASPKPIGAVNQQIFERRWGAGGRAEQDGLSTLRFEVLERGAIDFINPEREAIWERVVVRLGHAPSAAQLAAANAKEPVAQPQRFGLGWTNLGAR